MFDCTPRTYRVNWYAGGLKPFPDAEKLRGPLTELSQGIVQWLALEKMTLRSQVLLLHDQVPERDREYNVHGDDAPTERVH